MSSWSSVSSFMISECRLSEISCESFTLIPRDESGLFIIVTFAENDILVLSLFLETSVKIGFSTASTYVWPGIMELQIGIMFCSEARSVEIFEVCSSEFSLRGMMGFESRILCDGGFLFGVGTR